ncbi:MAG: BlaI/MecI/CopY family transcriptional regulator [Planctomycetota bacterium]
MADANRTRWLGELETLVMKEVWRGGAVTVRQVHEALSEDRRLAYTTVLTTMRNLDRKGYLTREAIGRGHVYRASIDEATVARSVVKHLLERLFSGSEVRFASALFDAKRLRPEEFERLRREILKLRREEAGR